MAGTAIHLDDVHPGAIERGAQHVVHAGIDQREVAGLARLQVLDPGQQHASIGDDGAARLEQQGQIPARQLLLQRFGILGRMGWLLGTIVDPQTAAHIQMVDMNPFRRQTVDQPQQLVSRFHKGIQFSELRADMAIHPDDLDVRHRGRLAIDGWRQLDGNAELVLLEAGGDIGVSTGIDIRIDPYRYPRLLAHAARHPVEALQLGFRLQIEAEDLFFQREAHLGLALGHPGEDHFARITARRQHP